MCQLDYGWHLDILVKGIGSFLFFCKTKPGTRIYQIIVISIYFLFNRQHQFVIFSLPDIRCTQQSEASFFYWCLADVVNASILNSSM